MTYTELRLQSHSHFMGAEQIIDLCQIIIHKKRVYYRDKDHNRHWLPILPEWDVTAKRYIKMAQNRPNLIAWRADFTNPSSYLSTMKDSSGRLYNAKFRLDFHVKKGLMRAKRKYVRYYVPHAWISSAEAIKILRQMIRREFLIQNRAGRVLTKPSTMHFLELSGIISAPSTKMLININFFSKLIRHNNKDLLTNHVMLESFRKQLSCFRLIQSITDHGPADARYSRQDLINGGRLVMKPKRRSSRADYELFIAPGLTYGA